MELEALKLEHRTIGEGAARNWVCLAQCGGTIEACGAGRELGDGVHDED